LDALYLVVTGNNLVVGLCSVLGVRCTMGKAIDFIVAPGKCSRDGFKWRSDRLGADLVSLTESLGQCPPVVSLEARSPLIPLGKQYRNRYRWSITRAFERLLCDLHPYRRVFLSRHLIRRRMTYDSMDRPFVTDSDELGPKSLVLLGQIRSGLLFRSALTGSTPSSWIPVQGSEGPNVYDLTHL
jgi:hypothetical protein